MATDETIKTLLTPTNEIPTFGEWIKGTPKGNELEEVLGIVPSCEPLEPFFTFKKSTNKTEESSILAIDKYLVPTCDDYGHEIVESLITNKTTNSTPETTGETIEI